jgi:hypothetical protein
VISRWTGTSPSAWATKVTSTSFTYPYMSYCQSNFSVQAVDANGNVSLPTFFAYQAPSSWPPTTIFRGYCVNS